MPLIAKPTGVTTGAVVDPCLGKGLVRDGNGNPAFNCDDCSIVQDAAGAMRTLNPDYLLREQFDTWVSSTGSPNGGFFLEDPANLEPGSIGVPFLFDNSLVNDSPTPVIYPAGGTFPTAGGGTRLMTDGTPDATKSISWTNTDCQCIRVGMLTEVNAAMSTDNGHLWQIELGASLDVPNPNDNFSAAPVSGFRYARMAIGNRNITRDDIDGTGGPGPFTLLLSPNHLRHRYQLLEFTSLREVAPGASIDVFFHAYADLSDGSAPGPFSRLIFLSQRVHLVGWRVPDC